MKDMKPLKKLMMGECSLTGEDMKLLAASLSDLPNLVELALWGNKNLGGSAELWSHHFKHMKPLQKLNLRECSLTGEDMKHIAASLSDLPNLAELKLWGNKDLGGSASSWRHYLKNVKHIQL